MHIMSELVQRQNWFNVVRLRHNWLTCIQIKFLVLTNNCFLLVMTDLITKLLKYFEKSQISLNMKWEHFSKCL